MVDTAMTEFYCRGYRIPHHCLRPGLNFRSEMDERDGGKNEFNLFYAFLSGHSLCLLSFSFQLSLLRYKEDGQLDHSSVIPIVDGGTEGFKGHARVIFPGMSACMDCTMDLYPPQVGVFDGRGHHAHMHIDRVMVAGKYTLSFVVGVTDGCGQLFKF